MTLLQRITLLAQAVGGDIKDLIGKVGTLSSLNTTAKTNLVAAINEVLAAVGSGGGAPIDDAATSGAAVVWSVNKVKTAIADAKAEIMGGSPAAAYDTLLEIANYITSDSTATSGLVTAIAKRVSVDAAQTFTTGEKAQARTNIDAYGSVELGNPDTDLVSLYTTAKA